MNERDRLIHERDRLIWLLSHTAKALNNAVVDAVAMTYNTHITNKALLADVEGLEFAIQHLKNKAAVGRILLKIDEGKEARNGGKEARNG